MLMRMPSRDDVGNKIVVKLWQEANGLWLDWAVTGTVELREALKWRKGQLEKYDYVVLNLGNGTVLTLEAIDDRGK